MKKYQREFKLIIIGYNQKFNEAYKYTNHAKWNSLSNLRKHFKNWKIYDVKEFAGESLGFRKSKQHLGLI